MGSVRLEFLLVTILLVACEEVSEDDQKPLPLASNTANFAQPNEVQRMTIEASIASRRIDGLCQPDEHILFQCITDQGRLALCAQEAGVDGKYIQFRQSNKEGMLLVYPDSKEGSVSSFSSEFEPRSGGGESYIDFRLKDDRHRLFSITSGVRPDAQPGEYELSDGLAIGEGDDKRLITCTNGAEVPVNLSRFEELKNS